jgi:hypothetical protein
MNDPEACAHARWGTVSGLDPELVRALRGAREARELRESEAIDLDALEAAVNGKAPPPPKQWMGRVVALLKRVTQGE